MSKSRIPNKVKVEVAARAGGRCELCGVFCFEDIYHFKTNIGENAHMIADSSDGPRGTKFHKLDNNGGETVDNLMFLCSNCHTTIDKNPNIYTLESLIETKIKHEKKILEAFLFSIEPIAFIKYSSPILNETITIPDSVLNSINFSEIN